MLCCYFVGFPNLYSSRFGDLPISSEMLSHMGLDLEKRAPKQAREIAALYDIDGDDDDVVGTYVGNVDDTGASVGNVDDTMLGIGEGFSVPSEEGVCVSLDEVGTTVGISVDSSPMLGCKVGRTVGGTEVIFSVGAEVIMEGAKDDVGAAVGSSGRRVP